MNTEKKLEVSAPEVFQKLIMHHPLVILFITPSDGQIVGANFAASRFYGWSVAKLQQMNVSDINTLEPEKIMSEMQIALTQPQSSFHFQHRLADGQVRDVEVHSVPFQWENQIVLCSSISDITERKRIEETLRESEERLREVLENSLDAAYKRNLQTNSYDYMSPVFARITGYTPEEMESLPIDRVLELMHPNDLAKIEQVIAESLNAEPGRPYYLEYRFRHKDGNFIWIRDKFSVVRNVRGHPLARIGSVSDVTDSKKLEDAMRESEEKQRKMIANISDVIAIMNTEGVILYKSPNIEKWFGWQPEDLVGTNGWDTVHPDDLTRIQKEFHNLLDHDNATKTVEYRYKCKDGSYKNIELTATNLSNDPAINGVLMNYRDITEKLRNERLLKIAKERRRQSDLLNELVRESLPSEMALREVSRMMGNKMFEPVSCFMIVLDEYREMAREIELERVEQYQILVDSIISALEDSDRIVWESPDGIGVIFFGLNMSENIIGEQKKIAEQLRQLVVQLKPDVKISVGIAEISSSMTEFKLRYRQAVLAVNSGFKVWSQVKIFHYLDIGVFQVLSSFNEQNLITAFIERTLGKLLHYDNKKKVEFISTLEALLLSENLKESADKLSVHYQTLLFRKNRLENILGVSFDDPSVRMSILTALYLQKLQEK